MFRFTFSAAAMLGSCFATSAAPAQATSLYTVDPYDVPSPTYGRPNVTEPLLWQTSPFDVGYDLLGSYVPLFWGFVALSALAVAVVLLVRESGPAPESTATAPRATP